MADPDFVPEWDEEYSDGEKVKDKEIGRTPRKRLRRTKSPEPAPEIIISDMDWRQHFEDMKIKTLDPYEGIAYPPIRIAAFNIQIFGKRKMKSKDVTGTLVKILQRYDLILIQEIRDSSATALDGLVKLVSQVDPDDPYTSVVSERLGRTNSKEQYAFMYRASRIAVADTYQFDDGEDNGKDVFQREPFAVRFYSPYTTVSDFGIIAIHTQPTNAVKEIDGLVKVYECTKKKWNLPDIMIAGDFNADEGYIDREDWAKISLRNDRRFKWMIDDDTDTTVGNTDRAYDRFVVAGKSLTKAIVPGSNKVFKFDDELGLTSDEAEDVSDHYPIEMELKGAANQELQSQLSTNISVTIQQKKPIANEGLVRAIYTSTSSAHFSHHVAYDESGAVCRVVATRRGVADVIETLSEFQKVFPGIVYDDTLVMAKSYMDDSGVMKPRPLVYGLVVEDGGGDKFDVEVNVEVKDSLQCCVTISRPMS